MRISKTLKQMTLTDLDPVDDIITLECLVEKVEEHGVTGRRGEMGVQELTVQGRVEPIHGRLPE